MLEKIHFETLGCRLNHDESEGAAHFFSKVGFPIDMEILTAASPVSPETVLAVINTCTVTGKAEQKARRLIRLMLDKFPNALLVVTGCYADMDASSIRAIAPMRISIIPGTAKFIISLLPQAMCEGGCLSLDQGLFQHTALDSFIEGTFAKSLQNFVFTNNKRKNFPINAFTLYTNVFKKHSRASLKVQDGCNCECSYCRIHLARGASVSLSLDEAVRRARELEDSGVNELVLTGVNLSQWRGHDQQGQQGGFELLLKRLLDETDHVFFRVSSFYPESIDEKMCEVLSHPRVQPFFHLSIQSGSNKILEAMRRPHSSSHVEQAIKRLRQIKENPFVSCDIIAGFPGEGEKEFEETKKLCERSSFAWIHAFPFSPRPGTPACSMKGQIPDRIKGERVSWLMAKAVEGKISYARQWKDHQLLAVVERSRNQAADVLHAVTGNYLHVECPLIGLENEVPKSGALVKLTIGDCLSESITSGGELDCLGKLESF